MKWVVNGLHHFFHAGFPKKHFGVHEGRHRVLGKPAPLVGDHDLIYVRLNLTDPFIIRGNRPLEVIQYFHKFLLCYFLVKIFLWGVQVLCGYGLSAKISYLLPKNGGVEIFVIAWPQHDPCWAVPYHVLLLSDEIYPHDVVAFRIRLAVELMAAWYAQRRVLLKMGIIPLIIESWGRLETLGLPLNSVMQNRVIIIVLRAAGLISH